MILICALNGHWIEGTVSFKMSQGFLRQVLIITFPGAHEADHCSTARFLERDTWLSFALCLVHHTHRCGELRPRFATQIGH